MSKENLDIQIDESIKNERIINFFKKNKILITILIFICILIPISIQSFDYLKDKENKEFIENYLKAEILLETNQKESINLFNEMIKSKNETIKILAYSKLIELHHDNNEKKLYLKKIESNFRNNLLKDIFYIKKILFGFDDISEIEIIKLSNYLDDDAFKTIKQKLLYDFYTKENQFFKANEVIKQN